MLNLDRSVSTSSGHLLLLFQWTKFKTIDMFNRYKVFNKALDRVQNDGQVCHLPKYLSHKLLLYCLISGCNKLSLDGNCILNLWTSSVLQDSKHSGTLWGCYLHTWSEFIFCYCSLILNSYFVFTTILFLFKISSLRSFFFFGKALWSRFLAIALFKVTFQKR